SWAYRTWPVTKGLAIELLNCSPHLHGDDPAPVTGGAARVGDGVHPFGVAPADLLRRIPVHGTFEGERTDIRKELRAMCHGANHDTKGAARPNRRYGHARSILGRSRAEFAIGGTIRPLRHANLNEQLIRT